MSTFKLFDWFITIEPRPDLGLGYGVVCWGRVLANDCSSSTSDNGGRGRERTALRSHDLEERLSETSFVTNFGSRVELSGESDIERAILAGVPKPFIEAFRKGIPPAYKILVGIASSILSLAVSPDRLAPPGTSRPPSPSPTASPVGQPVPLHYSSVSDHEDPSEREASAVDEELVAPDGQVSDEAQTTLLLLSYSNAVGNNLPSEMVRLPSTLSNLSDLCDDDSDIGSFDEMVDEVSRFVAEDVQNIGDEVNERLDISNSRSVEVTNAAEIRDLDWGPLTSMARGGKLMTSQSEYTPQREASLQLPSPRSSFSTMSREPRLYSDSGATQVFHEIPATRLDYFGTLNQDHPSHCAANYTHSGLSEDITPDEPQQRCINNISNSEREFPELATNAFSDEPTSPEIEQALSLKQPTGQGQLLSLSKCELLSHDASTPAQRYVSLKPECRVVLDRHHESPSPTPSEAIGMLLPSSPGETFANTLQCLTPPRSRASKKGVISMSEGHFPSSPETSKNGDLQASPRRKLFVSPIQNTAPPRNNFVAKTSDLFPSFPSRTILSEVRTSPPPPNLEPIRPLSKSSTHKLHKRSFEKLGGSFDVVVRKRRSRSNENTEQENRSKKIAPLAHPPFEDQDKNQSVTDDMRLHDLRAIHENSKKLAKVEIVVQPPSKGRRLVGECPLPPLTPRTVPGRTTILEISTPTDEGVNDDEESESDDVRGPLSKAVRGTRARKQGAHSLSAFRARTLHGSKSDSLRPKRSRKSSDGWWLLSNALSSLATHRKRKLQMAEEEADDDDDDDDDPLALSSRNDARSQAIAALVASKRERGRAS